MFYNLELCHNSLLFGYFTSNCPDNWFIFPVIGIFFGQTFCIAITRVLEQSSWIFATSSAGEDASLVQKSESYVVWFGYYRCPVIDLSENWLITLCKLQHSRIALKNRCSIWNRLVFVWNSYNLPFKSYGFFCANMQNEAKWLLTQQWHANTNGHLITSTFILWSWNMD